VGTAHTPARIVLLGEPGQRGAGEAPAEAPKGSVVMARLLLGQPIVVLGGDRFVLRGSDVDGPSGAVLGGGDVLDAGPERKRPRAKRRAVVAALERGDARAALRALIDEAAPRPLAMAALGSRLAIPTAEIKRAADALVGKGELIAMKGLGWIRSAQIVEMAVLARRLVAEHHQKAPLDRGLLLATLRQKLGMVAGAETADEAIRAAADKVPGSKCEPLVVDGDVARLASFAAAPVDKDIAGALEAAARAIREAGLKGMGEIWVKEATGVSPKEVKAILAKLVRDGQAVHAGELWFSRASVDELREKVLAHLRSTPRLTIAEFKDLSGLGRKQAIVLLELFDRAGITRREGDDRVRGAR
jgi:selenocysteine-specific elongation factor